MTIVIIGAGIMGVSTAYFLAKHGIPCTLVDACGIAAAASGRAGGFLARDWCSHYEMDILARFGFDLHMELAKQFGGTCGYRRVDTYSIEVTPGDPGKSIKGPQWIQAKVSHYSKMGSPDTTAQVHPQLLTNELFKEAQLLTQNATQLKLARAVGLEFDHKDPPRVTGVTVVPTHTTETVEEVLPATCVLLATGPWSNTSTSWLPARCLPSRRFGGHRAHGVVVRPCAEAAASKPPVDATCLFMDYRGPGRTCSPEVYPRPDGTVYMCGLSDSEPVPASAPEVVVDSWRCDRLREVIASVSPTLSQAELVSEHACYLPLSPDGVPVIGPVVGVDGIWIGTGHSCWGILTGPITGRLLASMIASSVQDSIAKLTCVPEDLKKKEWEEAQRLLNNRGFDLFHPRRFAHSSLLEGATYRTNKKPD
ncbi:FAD dependent oxidoreductase [Fasciola hepatica]|uniref:FAD dependent oxidoreductase n=1 Tax=Fasciola hepatica TaxID=6192 RepID=A0A4E0QTE3_FASHE|nr:FAD dependent oxidoreductase [Fasciola hepatica]